MGENIAIIMGNGVERLRSLASGFPDSEINMRDEEALLTHIRYMKSKHNIIGIFRQYCSFCWKKLGVCYLHLDIRVTLFVSKISPDIITQPCVLTSNHLTSSTHLMIHAQRVRAHSFSRPVFWISRYEVICGRQRWNELTQAKCNILINLAQEDDHSSVADWRRL